MVRAKPETRDRGVGAAVREVMSCAIAEQQEAVGAQPEGRGVKGGGMVIEGSPDHGARDQVYRGKTYRDVKQKKGRWRRIKGKSRAGNGASDKREEPRSRGVWARRGGSAGGEAVARGGEWDSLAPGLRAASAR